MCTVAVIYHTQYRLIAYVNIHGEIRRYAFDSDFLYILDGSVCELLLRCVFDKTRRFFLCARGVIAGGAKP